MRSVNEFANQLTRSYATEVNAQRAFDKAAKINPDFTLRTHGVLILHRPTDNRWVVIIVNPIQDAMHFWIANGFGVFGITA